MKVVSKKLKLWSLTILWICSGAWATDMSDPRLALSKVHAEAILKTYPPDQFVIFSLGRTTGLISERLRQLSKNEKYVFEAPVENLATALDLQPSERDRFFKVILPSPEELHGRHIVLHRVLWHSMSLNYILDPLIEYLKSNKYPFPLHAYLITNRPAKRLLLFEDAHEKEFLDDMKIQVVVDHEFQSQYQKEIDMENPRKGLTELSKYIPADPEEIIHPDSLLSGSERSVKIGKA